MENTIPMNEQITKQGLYFIYKTQCKILYKQNEFSVSDAQRYALYRDIYPYFDETDEAKYFNECYKINKQFVEKIVNELLKIEDLLISFENEEEGLATIPDYYGFLNRLSIRRHSTEDYMVYQTLRYLYLGNNNYDTIFRHFIKRENCPIEYQGLLRVFDNKEINI